MAKWKRVKRPKQYKNNASIELVEINRPSEYKKIKHFCTNNLCCAEFMGTMGAMWCPKCKVNSKRIKARMIKDGIWDKA